ncbi:EAL domain-containing protein [Deinococcus ficus]|uniref:EAL domain-containing protein n=1 Tax=Deinococcus ficus TaxID=317577 RepID=UPI0019B6F8B2|nr:EAL domain-containing protein [Deinococcus ficus]GHF91181.1 GGDEF-domain containing protein [Deinococcus ficus]
MSTAPFLQLHPDGVGDAAHLSELLQAAEPMVVSDAPQAEVLLRQAHALAAALKDDAREALALTLLAATFYFRSQFETAMDLLTEAKRAADRVPGDLIAARIANNLGLCAVALGHYGRGMEHYQTSLNISQAHGDDAGRARTLGNVGLIHADLGDYQVALEAFQEVNALARKADLPLALSSSVINTVRAYYHTGRLAEALDLATAHLPTVQALGYRQHEVVLRVWMLPCLTDTGQLTEAVRQAETLLPLALEVNDREHVVYVRMFYGQALMAAGRLDEAHEQLQLALHDAEQHSITPLRRTTLSHLSQVHAAREQWPEAYRALQVCQELDQALRAEAVERKAQVLGVQMQMEFLRQEALAERRRSTELSQANTALQAAQETLAYRATHDALTGLANRAHFQAAAERALQTVQKAPFGMLFIDLDRFKQVNDTLGHDVGDELLKEIARRLTLVVRSGDLVARMGGDEFTILLHGLRSPADAERVAHKVLQELARPVQVCGHTLHVTGSIGVAVAPQDGHDVTTLQKHADIAMYRAKQGGKNGVRTFQPAMGQDTLERAAMEEDLRTAIREDQLVLHYQAQFDARTRRLVGYEALVRWRHPRQGLLPPGKFIGVAEDSGLIVPLGAWVLREACRQASEWQADDRGLTMSVNVSALQLEDAGFLGTVQDALRDAGLHPRQLVLELTESAVLGRRGNAAGQLDDLRALGVRVALDDFGTGQSSLSLLRQLQVDILKIDRSFVQDAQGEAAGSARVLIDAMVSLAHSLNMRVTAEGVETPEQHALLSAMACDSVQGYLMARPLPAGEAAAYLHEEEHLRSDRWGAVPGLEQVS